MRNYSKTNKSKIFLGLILSILCVTNITFAAGDGFATKGKRLPWTTGDKWNLTSGYNEDYHVFPPTQYKIDYAKRFDDLTPNQPATNNKPVLAIGDGVIEEIRTTDPWLLPFPKPTPPELSYEALGKFVVINHGSGYYTQYDHLSSVGVSKGDVVTSGQEIGRSGKSGFSVGYHIQTSLWKDGWHFSTPQGTPIPMETDKFVFGKNVNLNMSPITSFVNTTNHFYIAQDPILVLGTSTTATTTTSTTSQQTIDLSNLKDKALGNFKTAPALEGENDFADNHEAMSADEPVNSATGNFYTTVTDMEVPESIMPIKFSRTYNSADTREGVLGLGWRFNYDISLYRVDDDLFIVKNGDGSADTFRLIVIITPAPDPLDPPIITYKVEKLSAETKSEADYDPGSGNFTQKLSDGTKRLFDTNGLLQSVTDRNGNSLHFNYDGSKHLVGMTDAVGRSYTLAWAGDRLASITDPASRTVTYSYDFSNRLARVENPEHNSWRYSYNLDGKLREVTNLRNINSLIISYDSAGRVKKLTHADGGYVTFDYNGLLTTQTDERGHSLVYGHDSSERLVRMIDQTGETESYGYDSADNRTSYTDRRGKTTTLTFDPAGNVTHIAKPNGYTKDITYNNFAEPLSITDFTGTINFTYDGAGNLTEVKDQTGASTKITNNSKGLPTEIKDAVDASVKITYDGQGNAVHVLNPLDKDTQYKYDVISRNNGVIDPENHSVTLTLDGTSNVKSILDARNNTSNLTYDENGNVLSQRNEAGDLRNFTYNSKDKLKTRTDYRGNTWTYSYDLDDNLTKVKDPLGRTTTYTYDDAGRRVSKEWPEGGTTKYTYDGNDNVISIVDPNGHETIFTYNDTNALVRIKNAENVSMEYTRDKLDRITAIKDWNGNTRTFTYDALGRLKEELNPLSGTTKYEYDPVSNLTKITDPLSRATNYEYNKARLLTKVIDAENAETRYEFDNAGRLKTKTDANGHTTTYTYDENDNVLTSTDGNGKTTIYEYLPTNLLSKKIDANTHHTTYEYDKDGRLLKIVNPKGDATRVVYDEVGNLTSEVDELGNAITHTYDKNDRLIATIDRMSHPTNYEYDLAGNLIKRTDAKSNATRFEYDNVDRLIKEIDPTNQVTTYGYDGNGNLASSTDARGHSTTYEYNGLNQKLSITNAKGNTARNTYNKAGELIANTDFRGNKYRYEYDGLGRTKKIIDPLGHETNFGYDHVGNLIERVAADTGRLTMSYDNANRMINRVSPENVTEEYLRDPVGNLSEYIDGEHGHTVYGYDERDLLISVKDPLTNTTSYSYTPTKLLEQVTDANNHSTHYTYNLDQQLEKVTDALGDHRSLSYDPNHNLIRATDFLGHTNAYDYDKNNRLATTTDREGYAQVYAYDEVGNLVGKTNRRNYSTTYNYDELNRIISTTDAKNNIERYVYDPDGNLTTLTDRNSVNTEYTYDAVSNLIGTKDALGGLSSYGYDPVNRLNRITNQNNQTTTNIYDLQGRKTQIIDPAGGKTLLTYNGLDKVIKKQNPREFATNYEYDAVGNLRKDIDALGNAEVSDYDPVGNLTKLTDRRGNATEYTYDPLNRVSTKKDEAGFVVKYSYDANSNLIGTIDPKEGTWARTYTPRDLLATKVLPLGQTEQFAYDQNENLISDKRPKGNETKYQYDELDLLSKQIDPLGNETNYTYDPVELVIKKTDAENNSTQYGYDPLHRLTSVTDALSGITKYGYDPVGNITSITDALGHETEREYDVMNRLQKETNPLTKSWSYAYDPNSNLISRTDANGANTQYVYDPVDRLTNINYPDAGQNITREYDPNGNLIGMTDPSGASRYVYDPRNLLINQTDGNNAKIAYDYDANRNRVKTTYTNGLEYTLGYNANNWLTSATDWQNLKATRAYDDNHNIISEIYPNDTSVTYAYDNADRLINKQNIRPEAGDPSKVFEQYQLGYDKVGNVTSETRAYSPQRERGPVESANNTLTYTYDPLYRLTDTSDTDGAVAKYTYDAVGNRIGESNNRNFELIKNGKGNFDKNETQTVDYTYNEANQLTQDGEFHYTYDNNGNRTDKNLNAGSEDYHFTFDFENRPTNVSVLGKGSKPDEYQYLYDGLGRRVQTALTKKGDSNKSVTPPTDPAPSPDIPPDVPTDPSPSEKKVTICHNPGANENTLEVAESAVDAHIAHGDYLGACVAPDPNPNPDPTPDPEAFKPTWYVYDQFSYNPIEELATPNKDIQLRRLGNALYSKEIFTGAVPTYDDETTREGRYAYFYFDPRGDVSSMLKHSGQSLQSYLYSPTGQLYDVNQDRDNSSNFTLPHNDFTYQGKQYDIETGHNYFGARHLDTWSNTWSTQDEERGSLTRPQSQHRYNYVENNPVTLIDHYGNSAVPFTGLAVAPASGGSQLLTTTPSPYSQGSNGLSLVGNFSLGNAQFAGSTFNPAMLTASNGALGKQSAGGYARMTNGMIDDRIIDTSMLSPREREKIGAYLGDLSNLEPAPSQTQGRGIMSYVTQPFVNKWNQGVGLFKELKSTLAPLAHPKELLSGLAGALKFVIDMQSAQTKLDTAMNLRIGNSLFGTDPNSEEYINQLESQAQKDYQLLAIESKLLFEGLKASYPECTNATSNVNDANLNQCMGRVAFNFIPLGAFTKVLEVGKLGELVRSFAVFEKIEDLTRVLKIADESMSALKLAGKTDAEIMQMLSETLGKLPKGATEEEILKTLARLKSGDELRFAAGKAGDPLENAYSHWVKHKEDFPELKNEFQYAEYANQFMSSPPEGSLVRNLSKGRVAVYDPSTGILGFSQNGVPTSIYKPNPLVHGYSTNLEYFNSLK